ncbi:uncharacterized protein EI90DRAFT_3046846 [Cantharellus anzutake]|uniref:uncharacterized protein n=1 Tax=Cantharellus anzutake TaxID=1750568 RepID=UPI001906651E|nr:uncharacterized protein EI90DRAFT_3046846 [Cantharellus anzutake]KAF8335706.1 hypothetical protein EI90DRAFT_3046846 [Cantharellus anzutake]
MLLLLLPLPPFMYLLPHLYGMSIRYPLHICTRPLYLLLPPFLLAYPLLLLMFNHGRLLLTPILFY